MSASQGRSGNSYRYVYNVIPARYVRFVENELKRGLSQFVEAVRSRFTEAQICPDGKEDKLFD